MVSLSWIVRGQRLEFTVIDVERLIYLLYLGIKLDQNFWTNSCIYGFLGSALAFSCLYLYIIAWMLLVDFIFSLGKSVIYIIIIVKSDSGS